MALGKCWRDGWKDGRMDRRTEPTNLQYRLCVLDTLHCGLMGEPNRSVPWELPGTADATHSPELPSTTEAEGTAESWGGGQEPGRPLVGGDTDRGGGGAADLGSRPAGNEHVAVHVALATSSAGHRIHLCHHFPPWADLRGPRCQSCVPGRCLARRHQQWPGHRRRDWTQDIFLVNSVGRARS